VVLPPAPACRFFQGKRVKVSLFLAEGIQQPSSGKLVAPSCLSDQVGLVRSFDDTGKLEREERLQVNSQKVRSERAAAALSAVRSSGSDTLCTHVLVLAAISPGLAKAARRLVVCAC
jgi:hypothetical protein